MSAGIKAMDIVILDTNIVLDLFLFPDPRTLILRTQLEANQVIWQATTHMRNELERVLTYAHIEGKLAYYQKTQEKILAAFDQHAEITEPPSAKAPYTCKDADDQVFIDLACHLAGNIGSLTSRADASQIPHVQLISKDKAVLCMRKRLEKLSVIVTTTFLS